MTNDGMTNDERSPNDEARIGEESGGAPSTFVIGYSAFFRHWSFRHSSLRRNWLGIAIPFALPLLAALWCRLTLGPTLGLFFGGILSATLLTPPLTLTQRAPTRQLLAAGLIILGIAAVWLSVPADGVVYLAQWLACCAVLAAYALALCGLAALLAGPLRFGPVLGQAAVVVLGLAWLSWPVWLSPWYDESAVNRLVAAHPLFAVNAVLVRQFGPWGEAPLAYSTLMNLQDVAYVMPHSVAPCVLLHAAIGAAASLSTWRLRRRAAQPRSGGRQ
jgi:hypothetical protein